jgi:hypothetical protein
VLECCLAVSLSRCLVVSLLLFFCGYAVVVSLGCKCVIMFMCAGNRALEGNWSLRVATLRSLRVKWMDFLVWY